MNRRGALRTAGLSCAAFSFAWTTGEAASGQDEGVPSSVLLRLALKVTNLTNSDLPNARLMFFMPLARSASHDLTKVEALAPHRVLELEHQHRLLDLNLGTLRPFGSQMVPVQTVLARSPAPRPSILDDPSLWLQASALIESDHPEVQQLAAELQRRAPIDTLAAIHRWTVANIKYVGYRPEPAGAVATLRMGGGDCTDLACVVAALARACGFPARQVGGHVVPTSTVLRAADYHDWTEVWIDGMWRVTDPQLDRFMQDERDFVPFRINGMSLQQPVGTVRRYVSSAGLGLSW